MILTGTEIEREWKQGRITIDPFVSEQVNPNSYNFRLGRTLRIYRTAVLDPRRASEYEQFEIPDDGYVLEPGRLYLAHTMEVLGSDHYAPTFAARSSVARLGMFINLSASLGDIGFKGQWTLQLYTMNRIKVYPGICIGQMMWWRPKGEIVLYSGKYQGTLGPRSSDIHVDFDRKLAQQRLPGLRAGVDAAEVGPKFAALAAGSRHCSIPAAFCVPASEYVAAVPPERAKELADAFGDLSATVGAFFTETVARIHAIAARITVPEQLRRLVLARFAELARDGAAAEFVVRSSGLAEDGAGSSLAGVHDSVLGVRDPEEVIAAIERCWRSYYTVPAVAARIRQGDYTWQPRLAVIVQEQIRPRLAGVAFSHTPPDAPGAPAGVVIEYVEGLADRLVAGLDLPIRLTSSDLERAEGAGDGPDPAGLAGVVALTRRLRAQHGHDVDVEWALDDRGTHLVQVRPQTAAVTATESTAEPTAEAHPLYSDAVPAGLSLGAVAGIHGSYLAKRGPAYRLAAEQDVPVGRGWVVRANGHGLLGAATAARLGAALAEGTATECVLDLGETLRQIVVPKSEVIATLAELTGARSDRSRLHSAIVRDFHRGTLGLITRLAGDALVVEYTPEGLMALNRGTTGAQSVVLADRTRPATEPGNLTAGPGAEQLVPHLGELCRFTEVMQRTYGDIALEWVFAGGRPHFVDYSLLGDDHVTISSAGAVLISPGTARGPLLRLTDDDLLSRLSTGPAVSIDKAADVSEHYGLAAILNKVTAMPEPPIIHAGRPYAVLSVLIGHVAGFVFDQGSTLGHLPILLREAGVPAAAAPDFDGYGEVILSDGTVTLRGKRGNHS